MEPNQPDSNPLDATYSDLALTTARALVAVAFGPVGSLVGELAPSAAERQMNRAIRTLQDQVQKLLDLGILEEWGQVPLGEEFDAALVRAGRAAQEAAAEQKREFIWYGLINGWVRTNGNPDRDRFQRLIAKYEPEHFDILKQMQTLSLASGGRWCSFENAHGKALVDMLGRERDALLTYMQEFDADGLVSIYDQPEVNKSTDQVDTRKVILWRRDGDRLLEFIADPVNMVRGSGSPEA